MGMYNGVAYNDNTDYQAIINDAVSKGDYKRAAGAEASRNAKIQGQGLNYETTNTYASHLPQYNSNNYNLSSYSSANGGLAGDAWLEQYAPETAERLKKNKYGYEYLAVTPEDKASYHNDNEQIRNSWGYSGGYDGAQNTWKTSPMIYEENKQNYDKYYDQLRQQIENQRKQAASQINDLRDTYEQNADEASRQAYINMMLAKENAKENLAASGLSSQGIGQRTLSNIDNTYGTNVYKITQDKLNSLRDLDKQLNQLNLGYDINANQLEAQYANKMADIKQYADEEAYKNYTNWYNQMLPGLYKYADDYMARIQYLEANDPNNPMLPALYQLRKEKVDNMTQAEQQAAIDDYNNNVAWTKWYIENFGVVPQNDFGLPVGATTMDYDRNIYNINRPYYNPNSGYRRSSGSSSNNSSSLRTF